MAKGRWPTDVCRKQAVFKGRRDNKKRKKKYQDIGGEVTKGQVGDFLYTSNVSLEHTALAFWEPT